MLLEVDQDEDGKRSAKRLKVEVLPDRTAVTLTKNVIRHVVPTSKVQTDGWKGYCALRDLPLDHGSVNHSKKTVGERVWQEESDNKHCGKLSCCY